MIKKLFALLITASMLFAAAACDGEGAATGEVAERDPNAPYGTVVVGSITSVNRDMISGWTNLAPNSSAKTLMHLYDSIVWQDITGSYFFNPRVIADITTTSNDDGSKTYVFTLTEGRVWTDGTPITAADYVFSLMLRGSLQFKELDANNLGGIDLLGYSAYSTGETNVFAGVTYIDEQTYSTTINPEKLPQYWEILMSGVDNFPMPMHVIAPGVELISDENGTALSDEFTTELLRETILNETTGYRYAPTVTSGPYKFGTYDATSEMLTLEINPLFGQTYDGSTPTIERIIFKTTQTATEMDELEAGSVDILIGQGEMAKIERGLALAQQGLIDYHSYDRNGYGFIRFHCDQSPTQFVEVRQAVAYLLDREELARQFAGGYATIVNSMYATPWYIYQDNKEYLDDTLIHYSFNPEKAVEVLEAGGWIMGADGVRYKEVDGEQMKLEIAWNSNQSVVSEIIRTLLPPEAEKVGMIITETNMQNNLDNASRNNMRDEDAEYFMFNMATTWNGTAVIPRQNFSMDPEYWGGNYNANFIKDQGLHDLATAMYYTDPEDKEGYDELWLQLIVRVNEVLPNLPLYANVYFDLYNPRLKNFETNSVFGFPFAVVYAHME